MASPVPTREYTKQHALLDRCVRGEWRNDSVAALQTYFNEDSARGAVFTGRGFERFDGGGHAVAVRNHVTAADVLSLSFLSITDGLPDVALDTTVRHAAEIGSLLSEIPIDVAMHETAWETYAPDSPSHQLWALFCRCGGKHRWVTANKLLARKRPQLLPVYDSRVKEFLGSPASFWTCLWTWYAADNTRSLAVEQLRTEAGDIDDISLLRCLDVILWMRASGISRKLQTPNER